MDWNVVKSRTEDFNIFKNFLVKELQPHTTVGSLSWAGDTSASQSQKPYGVITLYSDYIGRKIGAANY